MGGVIHASEDAGPMDTTQLWEALGPTPGNTTVEVRLDGKRYGITELRLEFPPLAGNDQPDPDADDLVILELRPLA